MKKNKKIISKSPKDIAGALGLNSAHAIEWELRNAITKKIIDVAKQKKMSVTMIAQVAGTSRARVTNILKDETFGISLDVLVRVLGAVGESVKISFRKAA